MLIENKRIGPRNPLLCVCYTNHALDQFLEHLLDAYPDLKMVRFGSRTQSERLSGYLMKNIWQQVSAQQLTVKSMKHQFGVLTKIIKTCEKEVQMLEASRENKTLSWNEINHFVEIKFPEIYMQLERAEVIIFGDNDFSFQGRENIFELWVNPLQRGRSEKGPRGTQVSMASNRYEALENEETSSLDDEEKVEEIREKDDYDLPAEESRYLFLPEQLEDWWPDGDNQAAVEDIEDIWKLSLEARRRLRDFIAGMFQEHTEKSLYDLYNKLNQAYAERRQLQQSQQVEYLRNYCSVVGCTVSGRSKFFDVINGLQSSVVLIEVGRVFKLLAQLTRCYT